MRRLFTFLILSLLALVSRADTAPASLVCFSVQIHPTTVNNLGLITTLSVSSTGRPNNPNGELELADDSVPYTHASFFVIDDPTFPEAVPFFFGLDVPDQGDSNSNALLIFLTSAWKLRA